MFEYDFMQRALLAGIFLSLTIPLIGVVMVSRKTSMLGEAMSHVSLAGVGLGLVFGFSPVLGAVGICILAGLSIERVRKRFLGYGDMATAIVTSVGLGLAEWEQSRILFIWEYCFGEPMGCHRFFYHFYFSR